MTTFLQRNQRRLIVGRTAAPMFWLSLVFLIGQAVLVVLWVDVPNLRKSAPPTSGSPSRVAAEPDTESAANTATSDAAAETADRQQVDPQAAGAPATTADAIERGTIRLLLVLWPVFLAESVFHWVTRPWNRSMGRFHFFGLLFCLCPSLRMCARSPEMDDRMWLPRFGWRKPDRRLRRHLERLFSIPMILIALLILPVLLIEFLFSAQVARYGALQLFLHVGTGVIWFAFAGEFILMVSVAERKLIYIKEHWLDLAIILLPLLSFLRSLQVARASRLFRVARLPQITKLARVYRLRGTALRAFRALLVLEVIQRLLFRDSQKLIERMEKRHRQLQREARLVRRKILRLKQAQQDDAGPDEP